MARKPVDLDDDYIKKLPKPKQGRIEIRDRWHRGLALRVSETGSRSFVLILRYPDRPHPTRRSLGKYEDIGLAKARKLAAEWREKVENGIDPGTEAKARRAANMDKQKQDEENKFPAVLDRFLKEDADKKLMGADVRRILAGERSRSRTDKPIAEVWKHKSIADITKADCRAVVEVMADSGKHAQAYNLFGHIRRFFSWCIEKDLLTISPMVSLKAQRVVGQARVVRDRVLTDEEIVKVWNGATAMGYPFGHVAKLLLLTGQRLNEICAMHWAEVDFDKALVTIAKDRMKGAKDRKQAHEVPLAPMALSILQAIPRQKGPCVFSVSAGKTPYAAFSKAKNTLDELSGASDWRLHDLRRTARTYWSEIPDISDTVKELMLAHVQPGIKGTYDRFKYRDQKRALLEKWEAKLSAIVTPPSETNVVPIKPRAPRKPPKMSAIVPKRLPVSA